MVFGFGRKKKKETDEKPHKEYAHDSFNEDTKAQISPPHRPGSMGTVHISNSGVPTPYTSEDQLTEDLLVENIAQVLAKFDAQREQHATHTIKDIRDKTEPMINELIQMGRTLEQDDLNVESIDKHLAIIVVRGKKQVIDVIRRGVTHLPNVNSIEDAIKTEIILRQTLKKVGDVLGRQTRVIHIFAKKHANRFKDNLAAMKTEHNDIQNILNRYNQANLDSKNISDELDKLVKRQKDHVKKIQKIADIDSNIKDTKSHISKIELSISEIKSSTSYKEYMSKLSEIQGAEQKLSKVQAEINAQFAKISRPLGRYEYGSSLDKEQQKVLASLVTNPSNVICTDNLDTISTILLNVRRAVATKSISVKDLEKTIAALANTADEIESYASKIEECKKHHKELSDLAKSAKPIGLEEYENNLSKMMSMLDDNQTRYTSLKTEIKEDEIAISNMRSDIQIRLRQHTGIKYEIT